MSAPFTDAQGLLFGQMDAKAREVVEKRFGVRLDSDQSSERHQAAWDVYQNASVKVIKAITGGGRIDDPAGYAATIARNSCRDYWRIHNPGLGGSQRPAQPVLPQATFLYAVGDRCPERVDLRSGALERQADRGGQSGQRASGAAAAHPLRRASQARNDGAARRRRMGPASARVFSSTWTVPYGWTTWFRSQVYFSA